MHPANGGRRVRLGLCMVYVQPPLSDSGVGEMVNCVCVVSDWMVGIAGVRGLAFHLGFAMLCVLTAVGRVLLCVRCVAESSAG